MASVELHCPPPHCSPHPGRFPHLAVTGPPPGMHLHSSPHGPAQPSPPGASANATSSSSSSERPAPAPPSPGGLLQHGPLPRLTPTPDTLRLTPFSLCPVYRQPAWPASSANMDSAVRLSPATETKGAPASPHCHLPPVNSPVPTGHRQVRAGDSGRS